MVFLVTGRSAFTTSGPMVIFGTKCPSMTSTWIQSAPAASIARTSSPNLAKSAARIDGAMRSGRINCLRKTIRVSRGAATGNVARDKCPRLLTLFRESASQWLDQHRQQVDRKLRHCEIEPGEVGQRRAQRRHDQADIAEAGEQADHKAAVDAAAQEYQGAQPNQRRGNNNN